MAAWAMAGPTRVRLQTKRRARERPFTEAINIPDHPNPKWSVLKKNVEINAAHQMFMRRHNLRMAYTR